MSGNKEIKSVQDLVTVFADTAYHNVNPINITKDDIRDASGRVVVRRGLLENMASEANSRGYPTSVTDNGLLMSQPPEMTPRPISYKEAAMNRDEAKESGSRPDGTGGMINDVLD